MNCSSECWLGNNMVGSRLGQCFGGPQATDLFFRSHRNLSPVQIESADAEFTAPMLVKFIGRALSAVGIRRRASPATGDQMANVCGDWSLAA